MNAIALNLLLHCYFMAAPHPLIKTPGFKSAIEFLTHHGLIQPDLDREEEYSCTYRGNAHIKQLLNIELPKEAWVDSNGKVIE